MIPRSYIALRHEERLAKTNGKTLRALILTDRLGDIIAAEPVARNLRSPGERLIWLVQKRYLDLLRFNPALDSVIVVSSYTETLIFRRIFKKIYWKNLHFDGYRCDRFGIMAHNEVACGINSSNYYENGRSLADVFALIGLGRILPGRPRVYPDPSFNALAYLAEIFPDPAQPLIIVHFTSDERLRSWPGALARETIEQILVDTRCNILELGLQPTLTSGPRVHSIGSSLPIGAQIGLFGKAAVFCGVDSGFAHVANAMETPSVLLLAQYKSFIRRCPWKTGQKDVVLYGARMDDIDPGSVSGALIERLMSASDQSPA
jgi:heptosyltransferase-3